MEWKRAREEREERERLHVHVGEAEIRTWPALCDMHKLVEITACVLGTHGTAGTACG